MRVVALQCLRHVVIIFSSVDPFYSMPRRHLICGSLGGDADTQAAIAGGIMGALTRVSDDIAERVSEDILDPLLLDIIDDFNRMVYSR